MAAPPEITIKDLSGEWVMNKTLSDNTEPVLALQGIGWFKRKAIGLATVTLHTKQYEEDGVVHIDIDQTATGGIKGTTELRVLDWSFREHNDHIFGDLNGRSRWIKLDNPEIPDPFLLEDWLDAEGEFVESYVDNENAGWTGEQIWGFATVNGERYHVRRVIVKKGDTALKVRLVYDWQGKKE